MGIFDTHAGLAARYQAARAAGRMPTGVVMERLLSASEAIIDGRRVVTAGTHNYLGLAFDEACIEAAVAAVRREGTGTCGSRIANGSFSDHVALERELAAFHGMRHAMIFSTGYQANLGVISTLVGAGDFLLLDADSHASIYDACKQTQAGAIRFKHNDPDSLDARLRRLAGEPGFKLVVVEGIYSMLGDIAPLKAIVEVCRKHGAYLLVDEAHSMGVLGARGCGLAEREGVLDQVDFVVGTFSKSLGAVGGYCVSNHEQFEILRLACRPYMFTASLPPATVASTRAALAAVQARPELREKLWSNIHRFHDALSAAGFQLGAAPSPIVAVRLESEAATLSMWRALLDAGYYVNIGLPPATPSGESLLRCAISAGHSPAQIDGLSARLISLAQAHGVLPNARPRVALGLA
ncbi:aminotransferase class I/II-fold pyridoxal phosphate-dependent enzyme [Caulobacter sp. UNC358MFTsu5.1]|uniref:serine palmitoyltransferase n=1 Tax=Caulobacter sp. UNC358MFTsu5.1 TaxID=1449049 RepID=UPI0004A6C8D2|nr:aminotransferase class I/II-fold pyridoxal phosphate-dependent enzyme [Caulobacter sp. UNC358MFTsu5.1]